MEFRILGPLEVVDDEGAGLAVGGSRERAILALLLLSANRVVSSERLADALWGDRAPEGATHALRVHVYRLRQALRKAGAGDVLVTKAPGYLLRVDAGTIDATRFEALVARARERAGGGDHQQAATLLGEALALWRGPALADVADAPFALAESTRLEEARLAALEERIEADLACGRHGELVGELDALVRAHPLRERLWAKRMLALYRAGRQADALRAYQELRRTLADDLGLEPSGDVVRLERCILNQDPDLDWAPPGRPAQPRRSNQKTAEPAAGVVTFLFTDLVGSTELLDRLGEDEADAVRRTHFALLRTAVSDAGGDEVKNLGDGLMVAFSSPLAALRCAVAIQDAIADHNRTDPHARLQVRVGLHAGEPTRDEDDYFGTPVVAAKRLCDRAEGGQILASELVAGLVGSRGGFRVTPLGPLALKGLGAPVAAVAIDRPPAEREVPEEEAAPLGVGSPRPVPIPSLLAMTGRVFVGRDQEVAALDQLWKEAVAGEPRVAFLTGEPGVGKTRLAAEVAHRVAPDGATVLAGACDEDLGVPYQPFVEALRHLVDHADRDGLARGLGRYPGELMRLVPELAERLPGLPPPLRADPETERYRLFDAVAAWLAACSSHQPVLLVLDDLQWAAKPTLLLLRHVTRSSEPMRLLVLGTYRDTDIGRDHPLAEALADLRRRNGFTRLSLSGLDQAGVVAFLEQAGGHSLDAEESLGLAWAIHDETEGNPFFVKEVFRHLTETGGVEYRDGRLVASVSVDDLGIPEGVRDVVGRRLSRLSGDANRVLACASVVGLEFDPAVVRTAGDFGEDTLLSALDEAAAARLVSDVGGAVPRYRFAHALVRATLYDELSTARRVTMHRRIAEAIEAVHGDALDDQLPALAHHWARAAAPAPETTRAVEYARRAGDRALAQLAHDEAVAYYRQALEMLPAGTGPSHEEQRVDLLLALGEAQRRAGDPAHRETLLEAARKAQERGDAAALARAALANSRGTLWSASGVVDAERVEVIEAALEMVGPEESGTRARLLATLAIELTFGSDREQRAPISDEALRIARQLDDPATVAAVLVPRNAAMWSPDNLSERLANVDELERAAERAGDPVAACVAWSLRYRCLMESGDAVGADHSLDGFLRAAAELGQPTLRWTAGFFRVGRLLLAGRLDEAERLAHDNFELGQSSGQRDAPIIFIIEEFMLGYERGLLEELEARLAAAANEFSRLPMFWAMLAVAHCELGDDARARSALEQMASTDFAALPVDWTWFPSTAMWAEVAVHLGDVPRAEALYRLLRPYPDRLAFLATVTFGSVAQHLGVLATALGRFDEAEEHFAVAEAVHERFDAATWQIHTQVGLARMLLARTEPGDAERARRLLDEALVGARDLGLRRVEGQVAALLA